MGPMGGSTVIYTGHGLDAVNWIGADTGHSESAICRISVDSSKPRTTKTNLIKGISLFSQVNG